MLLKRIMGSQAHWQINKYLVKSIGMYQAAILAELISKEEMFNEEGTAKKDGSFVMLNAYMADLFGVSEKSISRYTKDLEDMGFIITKAVKHHNGWRKTYKVDGATLLDFLGGRDKLSGMDKLSRGVGTNCPKSKKQYNKKQLNIDIKEKENISDKITCGDETTISDRNIAEKKEGYIPRDVQEEIDKYSY